MAASLACSSSELTHERVGLLHRQRSSPPCKRRRSPRPLLRHHLALAAARERSQYAPLTRLACSIACLFTDGSFTSVLRLP